MKKRRTIIAIVLALVLSLGLLADAAARIRRL